MATFWILITIFRQKKNSIVTRSIKHTQLIQVVLKCNKEKGAKQLIMSSLNTTKNIEKQQKKKNYYYYESNKIRIFLFVCTKDMFSLLFVLIGVKVYEHNNNNKFTYMCVSVYVSWRDQRMIVVAQSILDDDNET